MKYYNIKEAFAAAQFTPGERKVFATAKKLLTLEKDAKVMDIDDVVDPMIARAKKEHDVKDFSNDARNELHKWFSTYWNNPHKK